MKLFLLRPIKRALLWEPWFDKAFGFVVAAETEQAARLLAQANGGDETCGEGYAMRNEEDAAPAWLSAEHSACLCIAEETFLSAQVIIRDFAAA